jgi:hypothetical protein
LRAARGHFEKLTQPYPFAFKQSCRFSVGTSSKRIGFGSAERFAVGDRFSRAKRFAGSEHDPCGKCLGGRERVSCTDRHPGVECRGFSLKPHASAGTTFCLGGSQRIRAGL